LPDQSAVTCPCQCRRAIKGASRLVETAADKVSDLRQSRRLVGGGAAQSRTALRAVILRPVSFQRRGLWCAHPTTVRRAKPLAATPTGRSSQPLPVPGSALSCSMLPPSTTTTSAGDIPGTVKLWEPPRHSRGSPVHLAVRPAPSRPPGPPRRNGSASSGVRTRFLHYSSPGGCGATSRKRLLRGDAGTGPVQLLRRQPLRSGCGLRVAGRPPSRSLASKTVRAAETTAQPWHARHL
jgi:hypothetical protein